MDQYCLDKCQLKKFLRQHQATLEMLWFHLFYLVTDSIPIPLPQDNPCQRKSCFQNTAWPRYPKEGCNNYLPIPTLETVEELLEASGIRPKAGVLYCSGEP